MIGKTNTPEFGAGANTFNEYALAAPTASHTACKCHCTSEPGKCLQDLPGHSSTKQPCLSCYVCLFVHCSPHCCLCLPFDSGQATYSPTMSHCVSTMCVQHKHTCMQCVWPDSEPLGHPADCRGLLWWVSSCFGSRPGHCLTLLHHCLYPYRAIAAACQVMLLHVQLAAALK